MTKKKNGYRRTDGETRTSKVKKGVSVLGPEIGQGTSYRRAKATKHGQERSNVNASWRIQKTLKLDKGGSVKRRAQESVRTKTKENF